MKGRATPLICQGRTKGQDCAGDGGKQELRAEVSLGTIPSVIVPTFSAYPSLPMGGNGPPLVLHGCSTLNTCHQEQDLGVAGEEEPPEPSR